ncbi:E1-like protein-activating enzyme Gsa7p/Apg7p [Phycomyces blakesleeanus]|uniref:Ubiquitin-like modifier-activating enzyme ATG7 n=2 Tax=Phycomyces blakesleeanus TaxID=4837 RepID=A0A162UPG6_PHYB8|nr:hypothetical protein PHYBLDRAFT_177085 [Phycomyces blakesleeanus NRRL 1555(-)]OAD76823.1 hypothetical protein PHYBLDRAFT_177085 [Phycomyces blakesleeanus NRRL 1555(-)]|eukprot:XP_018294863.1 hypothetical protein PHYBLDRAFT_177085 [Phycomyces blakesleeanus NRRL 1555(-)]
MTILQFTPFSSAVDAAFWQTLAEKKLNEFQLSDQSRSLLGYYTPGHALLDTQGQSVAVAPRLCLPSQAFEKTSTIPANAFQVTGTITNTNTIQDFQKLDRQALFQEAASKLWNCIESGEAIKHPGLLCQFFVLTFADLKKYKFYYWFCFPAPIPQPSQWQLDKPMTPITSEMNSDQIQSLAKEYAKLRSSQGPDSAYFLIKKHTSGNIRVGSLDTWDDFFNRSDEPIVGFADPSGLASPGWPLRPLLALAHHSWGLNTLKVVCYRDPIETSQILVTSLPTDSLYQPKDSKQKDTLPKSVGWERNAQAKLGPRVADLGPLMDPLRLADTSVDLNLKLMRWRVVPDLDLEKIKHTKCLLLGAGTLGCHVARCLLGWGVRHITFVDNGRVSFSNPVRQPLYTFEDCLEGGAPKAEQAAKALKAIQPSIVSKGYSFTIPMPGHPLPAQQLRQDSQALLDLIESHDVVYLLTDSRESRWLPTMLAAKLNKIVINSALGFDTYLVMRHGGRNQAQDQDQEKIGTNLGCYFCNDIVAPTDSLTDRTLDQQCTVTRPGLAAIAGALAVELMVSLTQHKDGVNAPAGKNDVPCLLGIVPHQIRGFLGQFSNMLIVGQAYDRCTACSTKVIEHYDADPLGFLSNVVEDPLYLEQITGLCQMKAESDALLLDDDWTGLEDDF